MGPSIAVQVEHDEVAYERRRVGLDVAEEPIVRRCLVGFGRYDMAQRREKLVDVADVIVEAGSDDARQRLVAKADLALHVLRGRDRLENDVAGERKSDDQHERDKPGAYAQRSHDIGKPAQRRDSSIQRFQSKLLEGCSETRRAGTVPGAQTGPADGRTARVRRFVGS